MEAQICLLVNKSSDETPKDYIPDSVMDAMIPLVWASKRPGIAKNMSPLNIELKPGAQPVREKQYPIKWEARKGLEPLITAFLEYGLL